MNPAYPRSRFVYSNLTRRFRVLLNPKLYLALIFPLLVILSLVQMVASNRLATQGEDIRLMEEEKKRLVKENREIENAIAQESSIIVISEKVKSLHMQKVDKTSVVRDPAVAALP